MTTARLAPCILDSPDELNRHTTRCMAVCASLSGIWGIINGFLVVLGYFPRQLPDRSDPPIQMYAIGEFLMYVAIGALVGLAISLITSVISFRRIWANLKSIIYGDRFHSEVQKALETLSAALSQKSDSEIKASIGKAQECLERALDGA